MTKGGRLAGGILAIVGGSLLIAGGFSAFYLVSLGADLYNTTGLVTLLCGLLALIGGILLCKDINAGGPIALVGSLIAIIGLFINIGHYGILPVQLTITFVLVDPFLALGGSIAGIAVGSEL